MNFDKPYRFIRYKNGKLEALDIIPNKTKGWKEIKQVNGLEPQFIYLDESADVHSLEKP